jgi:hypothetical protein
LVVFDHKTLTLDSASKKNELIGSGGGCCGWGVLRRSSLPKRLLLLRLLLQQQLQQLQQQLQLLLTRPLLQPAAKAAATAAAKATVAAARSL